MQHNAEIVKKLGVLSILFFIAASLTLHAQDRTEMQWYFGNSTTNFQFDKSGRGIYLENNQAVPFGTGGSAVISDQYTGNLIFYTDGVNLYDRSHQIVPNGVLTAGPGGDFNQSASAAPIPGEDDRWYVFTNTGSDILVSIVDRSLQGNALAGNQPLGDVVSSGISMGLSDPSEGMIVVSNDAATIFWLISQNRSTLEYRVTEIDAAGTFPTTILNLSTPENPGSEIGSYAYYKPLGRLAAAPKDANRNVQIMEFIPSTGGLAVSEQVRNSGFDDNAGTAVFDVAWSQDGNKLYLTRFGSLTGNTADLYQYDLIDTLDNVTSILSSPVYRSLGIQRGPDDRIYHLYQLNEGDPVVMGKINRPDSAGRAVNYDSISFIDLDLRATQFPQFAPTRPVIFSQLSFTHLDSCQSDRTKFIPSIIPSPTSVTWLFGDTQTSNLHSPVHQYDSSGNYTVFLTAEINGQRRSTSQTIQIFPNDMMVDLGNDTTICPGEVLELDAGMDATQFLWSTGETSQTIEVDTTGIFWVEATYPGGCTSTDLIKVTTYQDTTVFYGQWYFGEQAGIDFDPNPTALTDENIMDSPEGCASFSDLNGDLLFYTDGSTVWNKDHLIMENGTLIGGDSTSTQSAIAVSAPYDSTIYYIFTTQAIESDSAFASYTIVDMKYDLARGKVIAKNVPLFINSTEKLTVTDFFDDINVLLHEFGNNSFREYAITQDGIDNPIYQPMGSVYDKDSLDMGRGYIKYSFNGTFVAAPVNGLNKNYVELFQYNAGGDSIYNLQVIDIGIDPPERIYGVEFSATGNRLFISTGSELLYYDLQIYFDLQFNINDDDFDEVLDSRTVLTTGSGFGALQLGMDNQIYMAVEGASELAVITLPDSETPDAESFSLQGRTSRLGLPEFHQITEPSSSTPSISVSAGCVGQPSTFAATGRDPIIEMYSWDVGVPGQAPFSDQEFVYTYPEAGTYVVTLTLSNRCDADSILTQTVEIFDSPEQPTNPPAVPLCDEEVTIEAWPVDDPSLLFNWSTGETTREITVSEPSTLSVFIINSNGCISDTVTTLVIDGRPLLELGEDRVICQNDTVQELDAGNPGADYTWTINGANAGTERFQAIDTSVPGFFSYAVTIVDPVSFCVNSDTVNINILAEPDVTITTTQTSGCGNIDGAIDITLNASGNYSYVITGPSGVAPGPVDGPATVPQFDGLEPGNYDITVTNNVTGCTYNEIVQIEDNATIGVSGNPLADCNDDGDIELTITNDANLTAGSVFITIQDQNGQIVTDDRRTYDGSTAVTVGPEFTTIPYEVRNIPVGDYFIAIQEAGGNGCVVTTSVTLGQSFPEADISFDPIQSVCSTNDPVTVTNNDPATPLTYEWSVVSGPGTLISSSGNEAQVDDSAVLQVIARGTNVCDRIEQIEVNFGSDLEGDIIVNGDPCEGLLNLNVVLTNGSGDFSYNWNNGAGSTPSIEVTTSNTYVVTVRDRITGCEESYSADIVIEEELDVDILTEPDCDNNGDLFLIAESSRNDVTFSWTNPANEVISSDNSVVISESGLYAVTVTTDDGACSLTESFNAIIAPLDEDLIAISPSATFCSRDPQNQGTVLRAGPGYNSYEWRMLPDATIIGTDSLLTVTEEGRYEVSLTLGSSCVSRVITVTEDCEPRIDLPNAFSPNGNGQNDVFFAFPNPYVTEFEIHIYNRWGELIFYSTDPGFTWDGNFNNKPVPVDTYAYVIRFESNLDTGRRQTIQRGTVTVIR